MLDFWEGSGNERDYSRVAGLIAEALNGSLPRLMQLLGMEVC